MVMSGHMRMSGRGGTPRLVFKQNPRKSPKLTSCSWTEELWSPKWTGGGTAWWTVTMAMQSSSYGHYRHAVSVSALSCDGMSVVNFVIKLKR